MPAARGFRIELHQGLSRQNRLANGSPAQSLFQRGDLVLAVNNTKIAKTHDLERVAGQRNRLWRITIRRGGQETTIELWG